MIGAMQDVTERTHAEATLRQNERLAAMGQLLAGVAHELNNPLSVVIGHATLLREMAGGGPFAERVRKIAEAAERTARIVRNFLAMARQRPPERRRVRLNQIVQDAVELLAYALRVDGVEVSLDLAPDMPDLWADAHQLHQVLVNLLVNAHQAMRQTPEPRQLSLTTRSDPAAGRVWLEVADTGPGVSASIEPRLFEPFFTTKPPGQGTGLGLSLCRGVVESHGGSIQLQRRPGSGAVFRVELPVSVPVPAARAADGAGGPSTLRGLRVLAVDDEPDILDILDDLLARDGHRVDRAANGRAALDRLRAATYDLIVSDVRMPEMDGPALYRELERHVPPMTRRFIFVTGDALTPETEEFVQRTEVPTVGKPFDADEIRKVVQRTVAAAGGRIAG
jgi:CheY-like chemotaxis protein/two-component sensor histidine kinase